MITIENVKTIIKNNCPNVDISKIKPGTLLREYEIDSMDFFKIILELQDELGKEIPDEDIDQLRTIDSILDYFKKNTA